MKVYGPYKRKDGRLHVIIYNLNTKTRKTISYPKYLMENHLDITLNKNETVDHIDEDITNNDINNFQILTRTDNIKKAISNGKSSISKLIEYSKSDNGRKKSRDRLIGNKNHNSHFPDDDIKSLRNLYNNGELTLKDISIKYNVGIRSVKSMIDKITYSHIL
jgi:hypothetical protein